MSAASQPLTILFADIGGSSALYDRLGDIEAHRLIVESLARMTVAVEENGGTVLRTVGDAILSSFEHCDHAFLGARAIQLSHVDIPVSVRVGFHAGVVIPDGGDIYGHAVNLAARVASFARVDEIMATADAVDQLSAQYQEFASAGDMIEMKGVPEAFCVHRLQWQESTSSVTRLATRDAAGLSEAQSLMLQLSYRGTSWSVGPLRKDLTLGRSSDNDISVQNDEASRHHARVQYRQQQFILMDDSTNGTYVRKKGMQPFQVRRDSIVLDGAGTIYLGESPEHEDSDSINFKLLRE